MHFGNFRSNLGSSGQLGKQSGTQEKGGVPGISNIIGGIEHIKGKNCYW